MSVLRPVLPAACKFESEALQCNCQQFQTVIQSLQSRNLIGLVLQWLTLDINLPGSINSNGKNMYCTMALLDHFHPQEIAHHQHQL